MDDTVYNARPRLLIGSLDASKVRDGVPRGRHGAWQRRILPTVFGEPAFDIELVPTDICPARPHIWTFIAWKRMHTAALDSGLDSRLLRIHSGYRSVAFQKEIFEYRLDERRTERRRKGLPALEEPALRKLQQRWTAAPGRSAHHTGFAIDLGLYALGIRRGRKTAEWAWLMQYAREFHFYPYLEEPWHWEFNPPGLADQLRLLRDALSRRAPYEHLLNPIFGS